MPEFKCPICDRTMAQDDDGDGVSVTCPGPICPFHTLEYTQVRGCSNDGTLEARNEELQNILNLIHLGMLAKEVS